MPYYRILLDFFVFSAPRKWNLSAANRHSRPSGSILSTMPALRNGWWTPTTTCFGLLWVGLLCLAPGSMMGDPGTLWHTVAGERMLQTGEVIRTDPFSFTSQGQPWVAQQWLAEIGMALLHRIAGLDALVLVAVTLLAATYAWLAGRSFESVCPGRPWRC